MTGQSPRRGGRRRAKSTTARRSSYSDYYGDATTEQERTVADFDFLRSLLAKVSPGAADGVLQILRGHIQQAQASVLTLTRGSR